MLIFEASEQHLEDIYHIEQTCFSHPWPKDSVAEELRSEHTLCPAIKIKDKVVGFCLLSFITDEGTVLQVAVLPEYRGMGIGKELTESAMKQARAKGVTVVFLEVRVSNTPAIRLYRSLGFEEIAVRKGYYRDGETAIIMQWRKQNENSGN